MADVKVLDLGNGRTAAVNPDAVRFLRYQEGASGVEVFFGPDHVMLVPASSLEDVVVQIFGDDSKNNRWRR